MAYFIVLIAAIIFGMITGRALVVGIATALLILPFTYYMARSIHESGSRRVAVVMMVVLTIMLWFGLGAHAWVITMAVALVIIILAILNFGRVADILSFRLINATRQAHVHPVLRDNWLKADPLQPMPADAVNRLASEAEHSMPRMTTHGSPGSGIAEVGEFGDRARAGSRGEKVLAGMLLESGVLNVPGVHTFWSLKTPVRKLSIDMDCVIVYGSHVWILDAKRYTPENTHQALVRDITGSEFSYRDDGVSYHPVLRMITIDDSLNAVRSHRGRWTKQSLSDALAVVEDHMGKSYDQTQSSVISLHVLRRILKTTHATVYSYVVLTPTEKGTPGIAVDTNYDEGITLEQAGPVIAMIHDSILTHPEPENGEVLGIMTHLGDFTLDHA